jgi:hypothetical protein
MVVGLLLRSVRVFRQFVWLEAGSVKAALSRPTDQRVTPTVGRRPQKLVLVITFGCPVIIKSVCFRN